jgi:hypothetical protein
VQRFDSAVAIKFAVRVRRLAGHFNVRRDGSPNMLWQKENTQRYAAPSLGDRGETLCVREEHGGVCRQRSEWAKMCSLLLIFNSLHADIPASKSVFRGRAE